MATGAVPREAPAGVSGFIPPHLLRLSSDARLVALIRDGRPAAFEIAYSRHHRGILSFCRHMLGDPQEAEDAVQQTFLAAYNDIISSEKPIHLRAWLFTIARNRCYSILRARREQPVANVAEQATDGLAIQVQVRQDLRDLVLDMRRLPRDQRAALVLAEIDALSHEQIGEVLGVPRTKVKALVFQARESLLASRAARETDCSEIREQLATQRGAGLRRTNLRRHLRECAGCRDYRKQLERQRRRLALIIPVAPTLALKKGVLAGTLGGGASGLLGGGIAAGGGGLLAGSLLKSSAAKTVIGLVLAGVGAAGTLVAARDLHQQLIGASARSHHLSADAPLHQSNLVTRSSVGGASQIAGAVARAGQAGQLAPIGALDRATGAPSLARVVSLRAADSGGPGARVGGGANRRSSATDIGSRWARGGGTAGDGDYSGSRGSYAGPGSLGLSNFAARDGGSPAAGDRGSLLATTGTTVVPVPLAVLVPVSAQVAPPARADRVARSRAVNTAVPRPRRSRRGDAARRG